MELKIKNGKLKIMGKLFAFALVFSIFNFQFSILHAVSVVANVNGNPVTDADITDRTKIMPASLDNRDGAKNAIIDDFIKIEYAKTTGIEPTDKDISAEMERIENSGEAGFDAKGQKNNPQMKLFVRARLAWQIMIMRAIVPSVSVGDKEIKQEFEDLEREQGLPVEMTLIRLVDIPKDSYDKLGKPKSCEDAEDMARQLGGEPQRITALGYELAPEMRAQLAGLADFTWSPLVDKKTVLVCEKKKTKEWGRLDDIVRQNAVYKRALFQADQLLKQLRRKATII